MRWDFVYNGEDEWDAEYSTEKIVSGTFPGYDHTHTVRLKVMDSEGLTAIAIQTVRISNMGTTADARDNKTYRTVLIGTQTWMAENLAWLPAGWRNVGAFEDLGVTVVFHTSTSIGTTSAFFRVAMSGEDGMVRDGSATRYGGTVRCLKDE